MNPFYFYPYSTSQSRAFALEGKNVPILEVEGVGRLKVKPDIAIMRLGVVTENIDVKVAQEENRIKSNQLIDQLIALGIARDDIETASYTVVPRYHSNLQEKVLKEYEVSHIFSVTVRDLEKAGLILDAAFEKGANAAENPVFKITNEGAFQLQALKAAVQDATQKAKAMAGAMGVTILKVPLKMTEMNTNFAPREAAFQAVSETFQPTPIQVREIEISARVEIQFTYQ